MIVEYRIFETLKSDTIEIVERKIDNLFKEFGLNKCNLYEEKKYPSYTIYSDRNMLRSSITRYQDPKYRKSYIKSGISLGHTKEYVEKIMNDSLIDYQETLKDFQWGNIFLYTDYNTPEI